MCLHFNNKYLYWRDSNWKYKPIVIKPIKSKLQINTLLEAVEYGNPNETSLETTNIATYELGDLVKNLFYCKIYPEKKEYHMIEAKISMTDLLIQCKTICEREGWDFAEMIDIGEKRMIERITRRMELRE